jgi:hypothetical protein
VDVHDPEVKILPGLDETMEFVMVIPTVFHREFI